MKLFSAVLVGAALSLPAFAAETYECRIDQNEPNGGWLPEIVAASLSDDGTEAMVNDGFIIHFNKVPVKAVVVANNDARITLSWRLMITNDSIQQANFAYRLTIYKADLRARLAAKPGHFPNQFEAQGKCKKVG